MTNKYRSINTFQLFLVKALSNYTLSVDKYDFKVEGVYALEDGAKGKKSQYIFN